MSPLLLLLTACVTALPDAKDPVDTPTETDTDPGPTFDTSVAAPIVQITGWPDLAEAGGAGQIEGQVTSRAWSPGELTLTWTSDRDGPLTPPTLGPDGRFAWPLANLSPGAHDLTLTASDPDGLTGADTLDLGVCQYPPLLDFSADVTGTGWARLFDAYWDPGGWLEITGNETWRRGALFWTERKVNPGNFTLAFSIATGGGLGTGADGFAVSVIDAPDPASLSALLSAADDGGCLGYGSASPCGSTPMSAFHVEFDTWYNVGTPVTDPTSDNHVAIHLDGDASNPRLWAAIPSLEDLQWRDVVVTGAGTRLTVTLDGATVIDGDIPGFAFEGGYLGVTGSTGAETNWHRFDNLQVRDRCVVPE
jgi:hypothetical protein